MCLACRGAGYREASSGSAVVWNASAGLSTSPEYSLRAHSGVTCGMFHETSAHTVLGGTQSGQVVLWDLRSGAVPVSRTTLTAAGHTHPIVGIQVVGAAGSQNLVTVCRDGRMCVWSLPLLGDPVETWELTSRGVGGAAGGSVAAMSVSFDRGGGAEDYLVGGEDGDVWRGSRKAKLTGRMEGHVAPVTGLSMHPFSEAPKRDFSHTVRL